MSEATHKPGPWKWEHTGTYHVLTAANGETVADDGSAGGEYSGWLDSPDSPDARLIAAAPDHHAVALELDRLMLVIESAVRWQDPSHSAAVVAMLKANRAAIAKAKGEA